MATLKKGNMQHTTTSMKRSIVSKEFFEIILDSLRIPKTTKKHNKTIYFSIKKMQKVTSLSRSTINKTKSQFVDITQTTPKK